MEKHRSYSPLYRSYIKDTQNECPLLYKSSYSFRKKKKKTTACFESLQKLSDSKKYRIFQLELEKDPLFSSGTLEREKDKQKTKKYLKLNEIPQDTDIPRDLRRLKSIQNLPETIEIPSNLMKNTFKDGKPSLKKPSIKPEKPDPPKAPEKPLSPKPSTKNPPILIPKPNPIFKQILPKNKEKQRKKTPLVHIENDDLTEKSESSSLVDSQDFSISIDLETLQNHYNSYGRRKSSSKDLLKKAIFSNHFNQPGQDLRLSIVGKKIIKESNSFILEKNVPVKNQSQPYFLLPAPVVKKEYKWLSLKPSVVDFNNAVRAFNDQPHRFAVEKNTMAKVRKVNSKKILRTLLHVS